MMISQIDRKKIVEKLGYEIVFSLTERLVISSTMMVAAILLMYRKGISED